MKSASECRSYAEKWRALVRGLSDEQRRLVLGMAELWEALALERESRQSEVGRRPPAESKRGTLVRCGLLSAWEAKMKRPSERLADNRVETVLKIIYDEIAREPVPGNPVSTAAVSSPNEKHG